MNDKHLEIEERIKQLENKVNALSVGGQIEKENQAVIIVCSQDLDKVFPAMVIASTAATMGIKVKFFFTIWGLNAVKKKRFFAKKRFTEKFMTMMMPKSLDKLPMSNLNVLGIGPQLLKYMLKEHKLQSPNELMNFCKEEGVEFTACEMTMHLMGIKQEELLDGVRPLGVATIISDAANSKFTLFV